MRLQNHILDEAERLFLANGFSDTTIEAIASSAGVAKKTIYARFGNKEGLFIAVDERILASQLDEHSVADGPLEERLRRLSLHMLRNILNPKVMKIYGIIAGEAHRFPELARRGEDLAGYPARELFYKVIAEAAARGEIACADSRRAAQLLETMVVMAPLNWTVLGVRALNAVEQEEWVDSAVALFFHGVNADH